MSRVTVASLFRGTSFRFSHTPLCEILFCRNCYHPMMASRNRKNNSVPNGLVNMSAHCSLVSIEWIDMRPFCTASRKWWYLIFRCFVRGRIFGTRAISSAPELSSETVQWIWGISVLISKPAVFNSSISRINGMTSLRPCDSDIYSLSVELGAISVCSFDAQTTGQLPYVMMYPDLDFAVVEQSVAKLGFHNPAKSASQ